MKKKGILCFIGIIIALFVIFFIEGKWCKFNYDNELNNLSHKGWHLARHAPIDSISPVLQFALRIIFIIILFISLVFNKEKKNNLLLICSIVLGIVGDIMMHYYELADIGTIRAIGTILLGISLIFLIYFNIKSYKKRANNA